MSEILRFPTVPVVLPGSPKGVTAFTVIDDSVAGIGPGDILICCPFKKKGAHPEAIVIVRIDSKLVIKRLKDAAGETIIAVAFRLLTDLP